MTDGNHFESDESATRRTFLKRSGVASVGLGLGIDAQGVGARGNGSQENGMQGDGTQEESGVQYYDFVVPDRGIVGSDFVNKFLFTTALRRRTDDNPFDDCFENAESQVRDQFGEGTYVYDAVLVDATEAFQLFGGDDSATQRLREFLGGEGVELPDTLQGNIGAIVGTRVFTPQPAGKLPTNEGYRATGGENCDGNYVRLHVHELPDEVIN